MSSWKEMTSPTIDDLSRPFPEAANGAHWELLSDQVMGGVSTGRLVRSPVRGRGAIHMQGDVSLANNGGFIQMALDLDPAGRSIDCSGFAGIEIEVTGNGEAYGLHLRTADVVRPWQSYRQSFEAGDAWQIVRLGFSGCLPHRIDVAFDPARLRRIGLVAIGRAFRADLAVASIRFY